VLGTVCTITLYDKGKPQVYRDIFDRLREIDNRMSVTIHGSDIDRINKAAGIEAVKVHDDLFMVIEQAVHYARLSEGAFDPTVGPLVSLWGIGEENPWENPRENPRENPQVPSQDEIDNVLALINWQDVELDPVNRTVFLMKPGMALDLGGIAKGYAADEAAAIIKRARIPRAIVDLGGNILLVGEKRDKSLWNVGLQNPLDNRGAYLGIVRVAEKSVVTSGVYERYFVAQDGVLYHHIFSPSNGYPANNGLLSVTVISSISMDADALSTAVFVLGYERGRALIESLDDAEAVFVFDDMGVRKTFGVNFALTDDDYLLMPD